MTRFIPFTGQFRYYRFSGVAAAAELAGDRVSHDRLDSSKVQLKTAIPGSRLLLFGRERLSPQRNRENVKNKNSFKTFICGSVVKGFTPGETQ
jgi:hypothetical protein